MYLLCVYISTVCGCSRLSATRDSMPAAEILAEFRGGEIRESDLPRAEIFKAEYALYQTKLARINEAIEKKFLEHAAQKRGMSVEEFLKREVTSHVSITDEEVKKEHLKFVESVKDNPRFKNLSEQEKEEKALARLGLKPNFGKSFEVLVKEKFRGLISKRREREEVQRLIKASGLKFYLTEPEPPVYDIPTDGHPTLGPAKAPVTLVVFSDFQCPFCAKAAPALKKLIDTYPGKVRLVFRNYPLPMHKDAQRAAETAVHAHEQGKFWEYHDLLFADQNNLEAGDLKRYAARLGLDVRQFDQALRSRKYEVKVKSDIEEGSKYRIAGTPAIYINGQPRRPRTGDYFADLSPYVEKALQDGKVTQKVAPVSPSGVLAEIDGIPITEEDLPQGAFYEQEERLYQARLEQTKKLLEQRLVALAAQKRGISPDSLLYHREIDTTPMPQELKTQYEAFQGYVSGNPRLMHMGEEERKKEILKLLKIDSSPSRTFEDAVMQKLSEIVRRRKLEQGRPGLMTRLMGEFKGRIYLEEPRPPVYDIATNGYPALGSERASVTIVEFADFQCPFCQQAVQTLNQVVARYADRVRVVFRHFPLPSHTYAQKAHEAAECANEQGKFWAYHDFLFANQGALGVEDLKRYAASLGLDTDRFNQCLNTGKYAEKVKKDVEDGTKYHVRGTPTFFINGTPQRIQTFEQFAWHITGGKEGKPVPSALLAAAGGG